MAIDVQLNLIDRQGDQAVANDAKWQRRSFIANWIATLSLSANVKTAIEPGFDTIQFVYMRVTSDTPVTVRVYKNKSPEYWPVDRAFIAFDTDIEQLDLMAEAAATVYVYVGGE